MKRYKGYQTVPTPPAPSVVTIGNFDGVHRGHRAILEKVKAEAAAHQQLSLVYTFRPHPVKLLAPHLAPPLINTYEQKKELLAALGMDLMVEEPFERAYAAMSPEQFVTGVLHERLGATSVWVGFDFTFGRGGKAGVDVLHQLAAAQGIAVEVVPPLSFDGIVASSTKIREFVLEGQVEGAHLLLDRYFFLEGEVVKGFQRGRDLGFPTANLATTQELSPGHGVYACWAEIPQGVLPAVSNVGIRPTFEDTTTQSIESHLLDFAGDLYGQPIRVHFARRLRGEQTFPSREALQQQIARDIEHARACLADATLPAPTPVGLTGFSSSAHNQTVEEA